MENIKSVMDDNRILPLLSGERIRLQPTCGLLFEVGNLEYASPALISRCGIVFVDSNDLEFSALWKRWKLNHQDWGTFSIQILDTLYKKYIPRLVTLHLKTVIALSPVNFINQLCYLLESLMIDVVEASADSLEALFLHALVISISSTLLRDADRAAFDEKVKEISALPAMNQEGPEVNVPAGFLPISLPRLEDFFFDTKKSLWVPWNSRVLKYQHDPRLDFADIIVPTRETVMIQWILEKYTMIDMPILLIGNTGTSKTTSVNQFLMKRDKTTHVWPVNLCLHVIPDINRIYFCLP